MGWGLVRGNVVCASGVVHAPAWHKCTYVKAEVAGLSPDVGPCLSTLFETGSLHHSISHVTWPKRFWRVPCLCLPLLCRAHWNGRHLCAVVMWVLEKKTQVTRLAPQVLLPTTPSFQSQRSKFFKVTCPGFSCCFSVFWPPFSKPHCSDVPFL